MIQAIPIWLSFLDPSFIPTQEQLTAGDYNAAFEYRAAECADAISMSKANTDWPEPVAHSDPPSRALIVNGLHCVQAWAEHFVRVCLDDPLGPRAVRFWRCAHNLLALLGYDDCRPETVLPIVVPLWIAEARKRSVRRGEVQFGPSGRYIAGHYIASLLPLVEEGSSLYDLLEPVGEEFADAAHRHLQLALSEQGVEGLKLKNAQRTLLCLCAWTNSERLRNAPGVFEERVVDAVMRVYAFAMRLQTETRYAALRENTYDVAALCCSYLHAGIPVDSTNYYDLTTYAISQGLLSLLVRTHPRIDENSKLMSKSKHIYNPVVLLFETSILGNMFILPIFRAVVQAVQEMRSSGTTPLPETRAWWETLVQRVERWTVPYERAMEVETSVQQERRCRYSRVSPYLHSIIRLS
jgi:hypothetical protein